MLPEPFAARDRRAVRHARGAVSRAGSISALGRAPGTDQRTLRALRRSPAGADTFPQDVLELQALLGDPQPGQAVHAIPGAGSHVPLWILGSSLFGAQLAALLGLPYAFASHFAPDALLPALEIYRGAVPAVRAAATGRTRWSRRTSSPQTTTRGAPALHLGAAVVHEHLPRRARAAAATDRRHRGVLVDRARRRESRTCCSRSYVGSADTVARGLERFVAETGADELIVAAAIHDHAARLRSYEILAGVRHGLRLPLSA